jgi:hypothetical protein
VKLFYKPFATQSEVHAVHGRCRLHISVHQDAFASSHPQQKFWQINDCRLEVVNCASMRATQLTRTAPGSQDVVPSDGVPSHGCSDHDSAPCFRFPCPKLTAGIYHVSLNTCAIELVLCVAGELGVSVCAAVALCLLLSQVAVMMLSFKPRCWLLDTSLDDFLLLPLMR